MPHNLTGTCPAAGRQRASRRARAPHGFTLLEMLLVLTLLSIVALLVTPSLVGLQRRQQFKQAAMTVLSRLAAAARECRGTWGALRILVRAERPALPATARPDADSGQREADGRSARVTDLHLRPARRSRIRSRPGELQSPRFRSTRTASAGCPAPADCTAPPWTRPITFYPDGTGTRAAFRVIGRRGDVMYFRVNRLTGTVKATSNP